MTALTASTLTRPQRAMQIAMRTSSTWTASVVGLRIPSQTVSGKSYSTTPTFCGCADFTYRVSRGLPTDPKQCKHQIAINIWAGRNA